MYWRIANILPCYDHKKKQKNKEKITRNKLLKYGWSRTPTVSKPTGNRTTTTAICIW